MRKLLIFFLHLSSLITGAQSMDTIYSEAYLKKSTSFAATHFGVDGMFTTGGNINRNGESLRFGPTYIPRLVIGGIHFWGHADFYVSFPIGIYKTPDLPKGIDKINRKEGIEVGAKWYPISIEKSTLRPFIGISFRFSDFRYKTADFEFSKGPSHFAKAVYPLSAGLTYTGIGFLVNLGAYYSFNQSFQYLESPNLYSRVELNPLSFQISLLRYIDLDKNYSTQRAADQENAKMYLLKKHNRLSTWYVGIGPSAGLMVSKSSYFKVYLPELYHANSSSFMPDITFGRHFHTIDANLGISYRVNGKKLQAFETEVKMGRQSFMLEGYKFLFNYLGFVPYLGLTGSLEQLRYNENGDRLESLKPALGVIFGWDIRVTRSGSSLLRTNLRWTPDLHLAINGEKVMYDHLEFNFIQYVHFFGRNKVYKSYRTKS